MKYIIAAILGLFCFSCSGTIPVYLATALEMEEVEELLLETEDILGLPIDPTVDDTYGSIILDIHPAIGDVKGRTFYSKGCLRAVWHILLPTLLHMSLVMLWAWTM